MLVDGFALALAGAIVSIPKFAEEEIFKTAVKFHQRLAAWTALL